MDPEEPQTTEDLFEILTGNLTEEPSIGLEEKLAALDAGRVASIYEGGAAAEPTDLDTLLAGMIETAEYEGEAALASVGAMLGVLGIEEPRARRLSVVIDRLVAELGEPIPLPGAAEWPEAEITIEPEAGGSGDIVRRPSGVPSTRPRAFSFEIDIEEPEVVSLQAIEREVAGLEARLRDWSGKNAEQILGVSGLSFPELRAHLVSLRETYAPKDTDAPKVRARKHEVLAVLLGALSELGGRASPLPGVEVRAPKQELARLSLKRVVASEVDEPARARTLLGVARAFVKAANFSSALDALARATEASSAVEAHADVWRAYILSLQDRSSSAADAARKDIEEILAGPRPLDGSARSEANLLLGRLLRRLEHPEALGAFKRAYDGAPRKGEAGQLTAGLQKRRRALSIMRQNPAPKRGPSR
ncbi:MAG: hypothetical protein HYV07_00745 [Deltaproteobacteria bacterium]|nr:hypothetical protein [Deltaproteobacteria bacterium]